MLDFLAFHEVRLVPILREGCLADQHRDAMVPFGLTEFVHFVVVLCLCDGVGLIRRLKPGPYAVTRRRGSAQTVDVEALPVTHASRRRAAVAQIDHHGPVGLPGDDPDGQRHLSPFVLQAHHLLVLHVQ